MTVQFQEATATVYMAEGMMALRDQLRDYQYRGEELEEMSFLDFMTNTYEGHKQYTPGGRGRRKSRSRRRKGKKVQRKEGHLTPGYHTKQMPRKEAAVE